MDLKQRAAALCQLIQDHPDAFCTSRIGCDHGCVVYLGCADSHRFETICRMIAWGELTGDRAAAWLEAIRHQCRERGVDVSAC